MDSSLARARTDGVLSRFAHERLRLWMIPVSLALAAWLVAPNVVDVPAYKLPSMAMVWEEFARMASDGTLLAGIAGSLWRLAISFCIGVGLAIPLGVGIALNRHVAGFFEPLVIFFQSIAGVAWVPLAIIWFGFGQGAVVFVVANAVFFIVLFNTITGVQSIQPTLKQAVLTLGGSNWDVLREVVLPGAMVNILSGLRTGLAFGWRALVAAEMIAGNIGLGYMTLEAAQWYKSGVIVAGIIVIGCLWLLMDRLLLRPLEMRTVERWGLLRQDD
ncbi:MAG: ABC transporter permease [Chloroflexi bacterium]|nr:ABC transporter permease [Chloroflexota bacterium]